jgi:HD-like signal output (HDOD) protein
MRMFGFLSRRRQPRAAPARAAAPLSAGPLSAGPAMPPLPAPAPPTGSTIRLTTAPPPPLRQLDDGTMRELAAAAGARRTEAGDWILAAGHPPLDAMYVVLEGSADLTTAGDGHASPAAVLRAGHGVGSLATCAVPAPYALRAREGCLWMAIAPAVLDRLAPAARLAVSRWGGAWGLAWVPELIARSASTREEVAELSACLAEHARRTSELLQSRPVRAALAAIPRLPPYATDLICKILDERTHVEDLVDAFRTDPALAALLLKTVNSPYYGLPIEIADYYHAILHLGTIKVYELVVMMGVRDALPPTPGADEIQARSKLISLIGHEIARMSGRVRPEVATTIGLLHDVGRSVVPLIQDRHPDVAPLLEPIASTQVSGALLDGWGLPERVVQPIAHQHEAEFSPPERLGSGYRDEVAVLHLSRRCYDLLVAPDHPTTPAAYELAYLSALDLPERSSQTLCEAWIVPALTRQASQLPVPVKRLLRPHLLCGGRPAPLPGGGTGARADQQRGARELSRPSAASPPETTPSARPRLPGLDADAMVALYAAATIKRIPSGDWLVRAGDRWPALVAIVDGTATLTTGPDGDRDVLTVLSPGDWLSGLPGGEDDVWPYTVTAREPCTCIALSPGAFNALAAPVQLALCRRAIESALTHANGLIVRHAARSRAATQLAARLGAHQRKTDEWVTARWLQGLVTAIPTLPAHGSALTARLVDDPARSDEILQAMGRDPAVATLVLAAVGSSEGDPAVPIAGYDDALHRLGADGVYRLVMASALRSVLPSPPVSGEIESRAHVVALIAAEIASMSAVVSPLLASAVGLLHDVGRSAAQLVKAARPELAAIIDALESPILGASLLERWGLPSRLVRAVAHQGEPHVTPPRHVPPEYRNEVSVLYLSRLCADLLAGRDETPATHAPGYLAALGFRERTHTEFHQGRILPALVRQAGRLPRTVRRALGPDLEAGS